jgi:hypothetical protein
MVNLSLKELYELSEILFRELLQLETENKVATETDSSSF